MSEPDTRHQSPPGDRREPAAGGGAAGQGPREHVRTDAEVRVDDELGTGDNEH